MIFSDPSVPMFLQLGPVVDMLPASLVSTTGGCTARKRDTVSKGTSVFIHGKAAHGVPVSWRIRHIVEERGPGSLVPRRTTLSESNKGTVPVVPHKSVFGKENPGRCFPRTISKEIVKTYNGVVQGREHNQSRVFPYDVPISLVA